MKQIYSVDFKNTSFFGNYLQMKAATQTRKLFTNEPHKILEKAAKQHLKENLFIRNHSDLDVQTFNYDSFPTILNTEWKSQGLSPAQTEDKQFVQYYRYLQSLYNNAIITKE